MKRPPLWSITAPIVGGLLVGGVAAGLSGALYSALAAAGLVASILAGVYHAEHLAEVLGEPYGTMVLAIAVTVIEVGLIVTLMVAGGAGTEGLARDTIFAAIMIIVNGIVGVCLLVGGLRHHEQEFKLQGATAALTTLAAIAVLTLVMPNFTRTPGPYYSSTQLAFVAAVTLVLYATFALVQGSRHREHFLQDGDAAETGDAVGHSDGGAPHAGGAGWGVTSFLLVACLVAVVLLAKSLAPALERGVIAAGLPNAVVGLVIAAVILMPEALAAFRAARANRLQTSLNLALGSALASIGLTIPAVAVLCLATGWPLALGLDAPSMVLLALSLFVASLALGTGRTTVLQGAVHLVLFAIYVLTTVAP
jgi:Ca2+:H+ antiporter